MVQRFGDALAAGLFHVLSPAGGFGAGGLAVACVPVCLLWGATGFALGLRHKRLAAQGKSTPKGSADG